MPNRPLADEAKAEQEADRHATEAAKLRRSVAVAEGRAKRAEGERDELRSVVDLRRSLDATPASHLGWLNPAKPRAGHRATAILLLSDLHLDEVVRPSEVDGLNAYDRAIATMRLEAWAKNVVKLSRDYLAGVRYDGCVLMLGGDTFSGSIHEELSQTNDSGSMLASVLYWKEQMAAAVDLLAGYFGKLHMVAVPGNHGRTTRKPRAKLRALDNFDWFFAHEVASMFRGDRRVTAEIPESLDIRFEVYKRGHLLAHGDAVKGGGGIGGIWPPIKRYRARLAEHANATGKPFDTLWLGHWHQLIQTPGLVVNGALKGWDEYAKTCAFSFEVPQQALAIATPEHGITWQAPVFCANRTKEGW